MLVRRGCFGWGWKKILGGAVIFGPRTRLFICSMTHHEYNQAVNLWADDVYRFVFHCCGMPVWCEDAVQDAYTALWEHRGKVPPEKAKSFLLRVAYNRVASQQRRFYSEQEAVAEAQHEVRCDRSLDNLDLKEALQVALQSLTEQQRALVQLKDVEGYSYKEIAEIMQLAEGQVPVYLFRARIALKKILIDNGYNIK